LIEILAGLSARPILAGFACEESRFVVVSTHGPDDDGGVSRRARAQQVALFRYQLICPALEPGLSRKARGRIVRAIAARTHAGGVRG
jgi:hypothetical protein